MCATLADGDALDGGATHRAGLAGALVDAERILEVSSTVDPIDAGAVASDAFFQYRADGTQQIICLGGIE